MMPIFLWSTLVNQSRHSEPQSAEVGERAEHRDAAERDARRRSRAGSARGAGCDSQVRRPKTSFVKVEMLGHRYSRMRRLVRGSGTCRRGRRRCTWPRRSVRIGDAGVELPGSRGDVVGADLAEAAVARRSPSSRCMHILPCVDAAIEDRVEQVGVDAADSGAPARARSASRAADSRRGRARCRPPWPSATQASKSRVAQAVELEAHVGEAGAAVVGREALVARPAG